MWSRSSIGLAPQIKHRKVSFAKKRIALCKNLNVDLPYNFDTVCSKHAVRSSKYQSPNLNTLPRLRTLSTPRIHKRRMRHPRPRPPRISTLQQNPLIISNPTPIPPTLPLLIPHRCRLARPVRIPVLHAHEILRCHRRRVRECQREGLHGPVDGAPDIDDTDAGFE